MINKVEFFSRNWNGQNFKLNHDLDLLALTHHDEARVDEDERAGPADAGGAVHDGRARALVQAAAVPDGAEELEEGVWSGWRFDRLSKSPIYDPKTGFPVVTVLAGQPVPKL